MSVVDDCITPFLFKTGVDNIKNVVYLKNSTFSVRPRFLTVTDGNRMNPCTLHTHSHQRAHTFKQ